MRQEQKNVDETRNKRRGIGFEDTIFLLNAAKDMNAEVCDV